MTGRLTIWIGGREALPVRAIPYVTGWRYSPDMVAESFARTTAAPFEKLRNLVAYHRPASKPQQVMPCEWNAVAVQVKGFETGLHELRPDIVATDDHVGIAAWEKGAALKLPAGVFVWLDEFLREREADHKRTPDDRPVILAPMLDADTKAAVLKGFEDSPRRGPDTDQAMIGYADFVAICQVDDPKNFGGFRVEANGLYVDLPDTDATLTPEERAAVTWHPTGQYDRPALPLPCTLGQLRAILPDAGLLGCLDEEAVDALLGGREHKTGWYDATMNAALWLKRASVKPDEAAMLLWRLDPLERDRQGNPPDPERTFVDGNEASPDYYRALKRAFEDVAETDPKPRTLLDWRDVAKREGLRYHEWIDEYVQARIEELPADSGSGGGTVRVGAGATASDVPPLLQKSATGKPATQEEIIKAFPIEGGWGDKLKKAPSGAYKWLDGTWAHVGSQKPGDATTYYPVKVAIALAASNPQRMTLAACDLAIKRLFPKWWDEWETESELLRNI